MDQEKYLSRMVRLLDFNGVQIGVVALKEATAIAREQQLEIIFLTENVEPAVVQIADGGRVKYTHSKNDKRARRKQHTVKLKELTMRYAIGEHDYQVKLSNARAFLQQGFHVKFLVRLRGREVQHARLATDLCNRFAAELRELTICHRGPLLEGRTVMMILEGRV